jgi:hypothetical protein
MEELIVAVLQFLFEFSLEVLSYGGLDWPSTSRSRLEPESVAGVCLFWFVAGCLLAWLSVLLLKHTFIRLPALRIGNLVLAPLTSAYIAQAIARRRSKRNSFIVPRNHFWQAFWFTLGLVTVRFAYAAR